MLLPVQANTDTDRGDPLEYAREVLPRDLHPLIRAAEWSEAYAQPTAGGAGMFGLLGHIVPDSATESTWHIVILVCGVLLSPDAVRGEMPRPQWPGSVEFNGEVFPRKTGGENAQED